MCLMYCFSFDDGRLTDGQGRVVDFRNVIVIMTSNLEASHPADRRLCKNKRKDRRSVKAFVQAGVPEQDR